MNTMIGLKNPDWDLNKSKYSQIDDLPLMASIGPVVTIVAVYLVFVLKIGPALMRKREAYRLSLAMVLYNGLQVLLSAYLVYKMGEILLKTGLVPRKCFMHEENIRNQILMNIYIYFVAKVTELLDTVFFVLRKKDNQVSFLHVYHHSIMVLAVWAILKYWPSHTLMYIGLSNSLVHVFMYTYYGLAALGPNIAKYLWWKKYMTKIQLIQFVTMIIQYVATVCVSDCPPNRAVAIGVACNTTFFLVLFLNFYRHSYSSRKSKSMKSCEDACAKTE